MARTKKYNYVEIEDNADLKSLRIKDFKAFAKMLQEYQTKFVFFTEKNEAEGKTPAEFMFLEGQTLYRINSQNYKCIEDYEDAEKSEFPDAESFYDALKAGINNYKEYQDCKKIGVVDKQLYAKAQKLGFLDSFEKFKERCEKNKGLIPKDFNISDYDTPIRICEFATSKGFKDFGDFDKGFFLGFSDKATYEEAKLKGFTYAEDYINAVKMGFDQIKEYQEAKHLKIQSKFEYGTYIAVKKLAKGIYSADQVMLMDALATIENNKKLSLKKLMELLKQKEEVNKFIVNPDGTRDFPTWYTRKLNTEDDFRAFLSHGNNEVKQFGIFDSDGDYFEVWRVSNKKIYVDGNNVAFENYRHRENKNGDDKPHCSNIKLVVDELYKLRFEEIIVIGDPGLKRRAADVAVLTKMITDKQISFQEAPSRTEADEFFIKKAKNDKCCIITNDTFRDWKLKDIWIAENIDRIRIPFMIEGGKVTFSGIEKLIHEPIG
ncbi:MAG: NYN domain-containing protein [Bacteroidia bacterium]